MSLFCLIRIPALALLVAGGVVALAGNAGATEPTLEPEAEAIREQIAAERAAAAELAPPGEPYFGQERISGKYVPADLGLAPRQLVILLHGYGQSVSSIVEDVPIIQGAREQGWILVVPTGIEDSRGRPYWSATPTCCDRNRRGNDDVAYLRSVIERHLDRYRIDRDRVVVVGLSNGAFMAYQLACHASDLVSAVVTISGAETWDASACHPSLPVSVYHIHGWDDDTVSFWGNSIGVQPEAYAPYPSAPNTVRRWAGRNSCSTSEPVYVRVPRGEAGIWDDCSSGTIVQYRWLPDPHRVAITNELLGSIIEFINTHDRAPSQYR